MSIVYYLKQHLLDATTCLLLLLLLFFLINAAGIVICRITANEYTLSKGGLIGFASIMALFQAFYMIAYNFNLYVSVLTCAFVLSSLLIFTAAALILRKDARPYLDKLIDSVRAFKSIPMVILSVLIIAQCAAITVFQHYDDDDATYVSIATTLAESAKIKDVAPLTGAAFSDTEFYLPRPPYYRQGWEAFSAILSRIFHIHPTVIHHTALPIGLTILHYMALYWLGGHLFNSKKQRELFTIAALFLNVWGFYSVYSPSAFLILRLWQGKAVLVNIFLPALYAFYLEVYNKKEKYFKKGDLVIFSAFCFGGYCLSTIGIYFIPLSLFIFVLLYSFSRKSVIPLFQSLLCIILNLVSTSIILSEALNSSMVRDAAAYAGTLTRYGGKGIIFVVFILSVIYILIDNNKNAVFLMVFYPAVTFCTVLNPFIYKWVAKYITGSSVYWRMLWYLPILIAISFCIVKIMSLTMGKARKRAVCLLLSVALLTGGTFIFTEKNFTPLQNAYKLPSAVIEVSDIILSDSGAKPPTVMAAPDINSKIRQYSARIKLVQARYGKLREDLNEVVIATYKKDSIEIIEPERLIEILTKYNVDYAVLRNEDEAVIERYRLLGDLIAQTGDYAIFRLQLSSGV